MYYDSALYLRTTWLGVPIQKNPFDLWVFQEILHETRPDILVETGTAHGGSALWFASMFDLLDRGRILTIDITEPGSRPQHPRILYLHGSSTAPETVRHVKSLISQADRVMVTLDSDHSRDHVLEELRIYSKLVTPGCYLIVEDSNINGHPVLPDFGPGPMEALEDFLAEDSSFVVDRFREKFLLSFNPRGCLRKKGNLPVETGDGDPASARKTP